MSDEPGSKETAPKAAASLSPSRISAENVLPPVRPPSAAFLMQLFFIPLLIVAIIVSVWLLFSWVAHMGTRPEDLVRRIENLDKGSWQQALTLAQLLRDPSNDSLRQDEALAGRLAEILDQELDTPLPAGEDEWNHAEFRIYLCRALGLFEIPDGVSAIRRAVATESSPRDVGVRRGALQAISLLAGRLGGEALRQADPQLVPTVIDASQSFSENPDEMVLRGQLRAIAAFALGLLGGDAALERLGQMTSDPYPDARYNAATGLARHGEPAALSAVLEMIDPNNQSIDQFEQSTAALNTSERFLSEQEKQRNLASRIEWKRNLVLRNGLLAAQKLVEQNPAVAVNPELTERLRQLNDASLAPDVAVEATRLRQLISKSQAVEAAPES